MVCTCSCSCMCSRSTCKLTSSMEKSFLYNKVRRCFPKKCKQFQNMCMVCLCHDTPTFGSPKFDELWRGGHFAFFGCSCVTCHPQRLVPKNLKVSWIPVILRDHSYDDYWTDYQDVFFEKKNSQFRNHNLVSASTYHPYTWYLQVHHRHQQFHA